MSSTGRNIFNNETLIGVGKRLQNLQNENVAQDKVAIFKLNNAVETVNVSSYGKQLLNETSFASFRQSILEGNEEAIKYTGDSVYEILFHINTGGAPSSSNLRFKITDTTASLENNVSLNCNDVVVDPNKSLIASYIGSDGGNNLNLRYGNSVYQQFDANGININQNVVMAQNKHIKQKIEDSGSRVLVESEAKNQYCLYSYEAGTNSGLLIQANGDVMEINNYKNSNNSYQPISINRGSGGYLVVGDGLNNSGIPANFIANGTSVFTNGASPQLQLSSTNIQPYKNIIPSGSLDIGATATRFNNIYNNISTITNEIRMNTFAPVGSDYRQKGIFFRDGFNSTSNPDNMSIRSIERNDGGTLVGDRLMVSSYGGLSVNYFTNNAGNDGSTGRIALFHDAITFHKSLTFDAGESITADRLQSTATTTDLFLGTNSISKVVLKGGVLGTVEFLAPAITPAVNGTNTVGNGTKRWAEVFATNGTINTSDRNSKKDIQPIKNALQFVRKLKPVQYKWRENSHGRTHTGFIAQDVLEANPLGLSDNWSGYIDTGNGLGLRYSEFISINTSAIKELDNKVSKLVNGISNGTKVDLNYHTDSSELVERLEALENKKPLESVVEEYDDSELKQQIKQLQIDNRKQEDCISQLISENMNLSKQLNMLMERFDKFLNDKPSMNIIETDDGEDTGYDILNGKIMDLEKLVTKVDNKVKKLTSGYNKLVKQM